MVSYDYKDEDGSDEYEDDDDSSENEEDNSKYLVTANNYYEYGKYIQLRSNNDKQLLDEIDQLVRTLPQIPSAPEKTKLSLDPIDPIIIQDKNIDKKLTVKDIYPVKKKKKKRARGKKKKGAKKKKKVEPFVKPTWERYDEIKEQRDNLEKKSLYDAVSQTNKQYELSLMKDSTIPPSISQGSNDYKKKEIDLLIDSAINSYCSRDYNNCYKYYKQAKEKYEQYIGPLKNYKHLDIFFSVNEAQILESMGNDIESIEIYVKLLKTYKNTTDINMSILYNSMAYVMFYSK